MSKDKYLEYYMDSKKYSKDEIEKSIDNTKKEFPNKKINVNVYLNNFGVYVVTFKFENKNNFFKNIFIKLKIRRKNKLLLSSNNKHIENEKVNHINQILKTKTTKENKEQKRFEKYYGNKYGEYKKTGTYKPI